MFEFLDKDILTDNEIELRIEKKVPANIEKDYVPAYKYLIYKYNTNIEVGYIDIRIGHNENLYYGGNIGYGIRENHRGNNYAMKACNIIVAVAKAHNMSKLLITCNPDNIASKRTIDKLGLTYIETVDLPVHNEMYKQGDRKVSIFEWVI